jgi:dissimilatory sulfite reductase (desulfoviridin) alpha/beta subunit
MLTTDLADQLVLVCPSHALARSGYTLAFDVGACTACGRCRAAAPAAVIASGEFELAATDRSHLVKRIPLLGEASR